MVLQGRKIMVLQVKSEKRNTIKPFTGILSWVTAIWSAPIIWHSSVCDIVLWWWRTPTQQPSGKTEVVWGGGVWPPWKKFHFWNRKGCTHLSFVLWADLTSIQANRSFAEISIWEAEWLELARGHQVSCRCPRPVFALQLYVECCLLVFSFLQSV